MPYKKKFYKKRFKKRGFYSRWNRRLGIAGKALSVALKTRQLLNVEYKLKDQVLSSVSVGSDGAEGYDMTPLSIGDTLNSREGNQVKFTSIFLKYYMNINTSATDTTCRVIVVYDKQPNGATFSLTDLLKDSSIGDNIISPLNLGNKFRFKILYNRIHQMSINGKNNCYGKFYKKIFMRTRYSGTAGDITDVATNNIKVFFISDEATNEPLMNGNIRMRFLDN